MLVLGDFGLAECGVSLDADRGTSLRVSLGIVALLVGPLQPFSTELGVNVVYPLSENTVLVIRQLFSNVWSAVFIPSCFKAMRDIGAVDMKDSAVERPQYAFSFYLLIVLHAAATVFFATLMAGICVMNKKRKERRQKAEAARAFFHIAEPNSEQVPLMSPVV
jgi:hypothetical protein